MEARYCHGLLTLLLFVGCATNEPAEVIAPDEPLAGTVVYVDDSTEWRVHIFKEHLLYSEAVAVNLPAPYVLPTREEAAVLKTCTYPHAERFVTSDGFTFSMPSASVSKAGSKTKYSVLGLYIWPTVITQTW